MMQDPNSLPAGRPGQHTMILPGAGQQAVFAWLVEVKGQRPGQLYRLRLPSTTIGREAGKDIALGDPATSILHAHVDARDDGAGGLQWTLVDDHGTNHTMVNGEVIGSHTLADGDRVVIGQTTLIFKQL